MFRSMAKAENTGAIFRWSRDFFQPPAGADSTQRSNSFGIGSIETQPRP